MEYLCTTTLLREAHRVDLLHGVSLIESNINGIVHAHKSAYLWGLQMPFLLCLQSFWWDFYNDHEKVLNVDIPKCYVNR